MRAADYIVDVGPGAGEHGGEIVATGTAEEIMQNERSVTGAYLSGRRYIKIPDKRKAPTGWLKILGAAQNNLKNMNVEIPLGVFTCVTGVSGSGKSSLINEILYKRLARELNHARTIPGKHKDILGMEQLDKVIDIDQSSNRKNAAFQSGNLYRRLRSDSGSVRFHAGRKGERLQERTFQLQYQRRSL